MTPDDPARERAREHVKNVRDLWYHLMTYVLVCALMVVLDLRAGGAGEVAGLDWAYWVIIFWGFGVAGHAISVFFDEHRVDRLAARLRNGGSDGT
jgi:hypothetical protein